MHAVSRVGDGFRAIFRAPALILAEISWRWSWGVAAYWLVTFSLAEYLDSLRVSEADRLFLRSANPLLVNHAIGNVLHGSGPRLVRMIIILVPALVVLWSFAAAMGRRVTLQFLVRHERLRFRSLLGLSFLRAALILVTALALIGTAILAAIFVAPALDPAASSAPGSNPQAGIAAGVVLLLLVVIIYGFAAINWLLSLAPILAVRAGRSTFASLDAALICFRARKREFIGVGAIFFLLHLVAVFVTGFVALFAIGLLAQVGVPAAVLAAITVTLIYLAATDFLYIARLAAYVAIVDSDDSPALQPAILPEPPMAPVPAETD